MLWLGIKYEESHLKAMVLPLVVQARLLLLLMLRYLGQVDQISYISLLQGQQLKTRYIYLLIKNLIRLTYKICTKKVVYPDVNTSYYIFFSVIMNSI